MKDRFKREFGATIDEFMDEPSTGGGGDSGKEKEEEVIVKETEEGDEELLERLMKANEAIDSLEN